MKNKIKSFIIINVYLLVVLILFPQHGIAQNLNNNKLKSSMIRSYNNRSYYNNSVTEHQKQSRQINRPRLTGFTEKPIEKTSDIVSTNNKEITFPAPLKKPLTKILKKEIPKKDLKKDRSLISTIVQVDRLKISDIQDPYKKEKHFDTKKQTFGPLEKLSQGHNDQEINHNVKSISENPKKIIFKDTENEASSDHSKVENYQAKILNELPPSPDQIKAINISSSIKDNNSNNQVLAKIPTPSIKPKIHIPQLAIASKKISNSKPSKYKISKYDIHAVNKIKQDGPSVKASPPGAVSIEMLPIPDNTRIVTSQDIQKASNLINTQNTAKTPRPPPNADQVYTNLISMHLDPFSQSLSKEAISILKDQVLNALSNNPDWQLQIQSFASHSDKISKDAEKISLSRALEAQNILINYGISKERLDIRALGSRTNRTPTDRVDLVFKSMPLH